MLRFSAAEDGMAKSFWFIQANSRNSEAEMPRLLTPEAKTGQLCALGDATGRSPEQPAPCRRFVWLTGRHG